MSGVILLKPGQYVASDVVAVVISMMGRSSFPANTRRIHSFFSGVRWSSSVLQKTMVFSKHEAFPFSRWLEEGLDDLLLSRVLMMSGDFERYVLTENGKRFIEQHLHQLFSEQELEELRRLAESFAETQLL